MQETVKKKFFFEVITSHDVPIIGSIKKRMLVIGSQ